MSDEKDAGELIVALVDDQLAEERARKTSVEQRGLAVITSSGVLVTLLLGLSAVWTKVANFRPTEFMTVVVAIATVFFLAAAALGMGCNAIRKYEEAKVGDLKDLVNDFNRWRLPKRAAQIAFTQTKVGLLRTARQKNNDKAALLVWAVFLEGLAVLCVGIVLITILSSPVSPP